jgi:uncharacterized membrane protein
VNFERDYFDKINMFKEHLISYLSAILQTVRQLTMPLMIVYYLGFLMLFIAIEPQIEGITNTERVKEKFLCSVMWPLGAILLLFTVIGLVCYLSYVNNKASSFNHTN